MHRAVNAGAIADNYFFELFITLFIIMALQKEKRKRYYSRVCVQYCKKLDQSVHNSRADWLPANPECGVSPPQGNGQALEHVNR